MNQIRWLLPPNGFLPSAVIRKGSRMSAKSRKVLFVAIAYTELNFATQCSFADASRSLDLSLIKYYFIIVV